jgi:hypothetical protein
MAWKNNNREIIKVGTLFEKDKKEYVVTDVWFDYGGHMTIVEYVRVNNPYSILKFVHNLVDEQIDEIKIEEE